MKLPARRQNLVGRDHVSAPEAVLCGDQGVIRCGL